MYDELIKMLRTCSERDSCIGWEKACPYLRTRVCNNKAEKAADAIEELQQITTHYEEESKGWWLAACDAKEERERLKEQIPKWIPVTERLPDENGKYLTVFTVNSIPPRPVIEVCCYAKDLYKIDKYDFHDKKKKSGFYQYDGEWGFFEMSDISHWMPLPQPPKEET